MNDLLVKIATPFIYLFELFDALVGFILFLLITLIPGAMLIAAIILLSQIVREIFI